MADSKEDDPKDKKSEDKSSGQKPTPPKRVVVTYGVKRKEEDEEIPSEILPHPPIEVVKSPVESESSRGVTGKIGGTATIRSHVHQEVPDEILPRMVSHPQRKGAEPPPPPSIDVPPSTGGIPESRNTTTRSSSAGLALFLSLLTSIAIIGLIVLAYFSQQQLADIQDQTNSDQTEVSKLATQTRDSLEQFQAELDANIKTRTKLQELQQDLERSQTNFVGLRGNRDWVLAEVNYLVFMANERLQVAKDIGTAAAQLKVAEDRLSTLADPSLLPIKTALTDDIKKLLNSPQVNRQELWEQLNGLSPLISTLKFKMLGKLEEEAKPITTSNATWKGALQNSWKELKGLIKITRIEQNPIPVAFNEQEQAQTLRTLQLLLQQAQWAVLQGDTKVYQNSLKTLENYVNTYFVENADQRALLNRLSQLEQQRVEFSMPDVSNSLRALQGIKG